jgi:hypothetical protein
MQMQSPPPGNHTSAVAVSNVSRNGSWLMHDDEELFVPLGEIPWCRDATIEQVCEAKWPSPRHRYWPKLDVDLAVDSIREPQKFPLVSPAGVQLRVRTGRDT